ncbi:hypothetical protein ANCCAN_29880 [Ancylostoma caninum]|uniref:Uncharacterized protein n=1 Tax=Ancylostoma caninum TaxID=29170 RepID=A0A368EXD4_ANCCA|nr:hypothetical protein ANCCAN_29880 [Ancylostoma caninum]
MTLIRQDTIGYDVGPHHPVNTDASGSAPSSGYCYSVLLLPFFLKYHSRRLAQLSSSPEAFQLGNIAVDLFFLCDAGLSDLVYSQETVAGGDQWQCDESTPISFLWAARWVSFAFSAGHR